MNDMRKIMEAVKPLFENNADPSETDDPHRHFSKGEVVDHHIMGKVTVLAVTDRDIYGMPAEFRVRKQDGSEQVVDHDYLAGYHDENLADLRETSEDDDMDALIDEVIHQISKDVRNGDWSAIAELLDSVPADKLAGYLSDY